MVIPWNTIITTIVGIIISVLTGYLSLKVRQLDQKNLAYRKEREAKEADEAENQRIRQESNNRLTLGIARVLLLSFYQQCMIKQFYTTQERQVYHQIFTAYQLAGGDGILHTLAEKVVALPTEPPKAD